MKVALVVDIIRQEEKLLVKALNERAVQFDIINVAQEPLPFSKELSRYDVGIIRPVSMYRSLYAAAVLESAGVHTINSSEVITNCGDKIIAYSKLFREGIPIPDSEIAMSEESTLKAYEKRGFPLVDKPPIGSWGRLVSLIKDLYEGKTIIEHREMLGNSALKVHIVQEYVGHKHRDIRCIVLGKELLGCYARNVAANDWRANIALGGSPSTVEVDNNLRSTVLRAASVMRGEFVSLDILEHEKKGYLVNEVNDNPEFKGFMVALNISVAEKLVDYIKENYA